MNSRIIIASITLLSLFSCENRQTNQINNSGDSNNSGERKSSIENKEPVCIDNQLNKWSYHNKFEIELPKGYYFSSSLIYSNDSMKIGEVSADYELLKTEITKQMYADFYKNRGKIITEENIYEFIDNDEENDIEIVKFDSIIFKERKWFYAVFETEFEGLNEYGSWNAFDFNNIENNRFTSITFYNRNLKNLDIRTYTEILSTVKYID